ncbi:hypothetical protein D9601_13955 [Sphingomonas sp. MA1305]|uniref:hypothetical protein n=1 Tax=unclassified Sphingomonas TaxID=196159 RepID=UPI0018E02641|nr:hypothetical protein [Sphingomonas sp. MA1305]MBI0476451.1 hypothetical protein [Sphingomonas sp. MA1305]
MSREFYDIAFDEPAALLTITARGFWTIPVVSKFTAEVLARGTALRLRHGAFCTLADLRQSTVHTGPVVDLLTLFMPKAMKVTSAPVAAVASSSLAKLQTERYLIGDNCRTFLSIDEARAWMQQRWADR